VKQASKNNMSNLISSAAQENKREEIIIYKFFTTF